MNMSQAIFTAITENTTVEVVSPLATYVILAPKTIVSRMENMGKRIVQIVGAGNQKLDYLRTIKAYEHFQLEKGSPIQIELVNGDIVRAMFHHFYALNDPSKAVRLIAYDANQNEINADVSKLRF